VASLASFSTANPDASIFPGLPNFLPDPRDGVAAPEADLTAVEAMLAVGAARESHTLSEHEVYAVLQAAGIDVPEHYVHPTSAPLADLPKHLVKGKKYVCKAVITGCTHKTDIGAVSFNATTETCQAAFTDFVEKFGDGKHGPLEGILFAEQLDFPKGGLGGGEWLLSAYEDPFFGPTLAFGVGGTSVEYAKEVFRDGQAQAFLPASLDLTTGVVSDLIASLPANELLTGRVRGVDRRIADGAVTDALCGLQQLVRWYSTQNPAAEYVIREIEVNPAVTSGGKLLALDGVLIVEKNPSFGKPASELHPIYGARKSLKNTSALLKPTSAAVMGASGKNPTNSCSVILRKLKIADSMNTDKLVAIHPRETEIEGVRCVKSIDDLTEPVDLLVVGIPASAAGPAISDAVQKGVAKSILVISGGFAETEAGKKLQQAVEDDLAAAAPEKRPLIAGPNTVGSLTTGGADTIFTPRHKSSRTEFGATRSAIIAQSGAFLITRMSDLADSVNPRMAVSVGNQMDMSATDYLEWALSTDDEDIQDICVFGMYIEGLKEGEGMRLMRLVAEAGRQNKAVILYKAGRSTQGQEAAKGHTAAMAGDYGLFRRLLETSGAVVCETASDFEAALTTAALCPEILSLRHSDRPVSIIGVTNAGYEKCAMADHLFRNESPYMQLAKFDQPTQDAVADIFAQWRMSEVVDAGDVLDVTPMLGDSGWFDLCDTLLSSDSTDVGLLTVVPEVGTLATLEEEMWNEDTILQSLLKLKAKHTKPFICSMESGRLYEPFARACRRAGIPCFRHADEAAASVRLLVEALRK
jgi:acyl-CoA synthetase (NDP forming)